jgi:hypothetical protein
MVVNNLIDRRQAWRLVTAAFLTAVIVSLIGMTQIPSGQRVSAPCEGKEGEPNTFGGYLLLLIAVAGGIALETASLRTRAIYLGLAGLMSIPFMFTLSRTSYVGAIPAVAIGVLTSRRRLMVVALIVGLVASPVVLTILPESVTKRVHYTFEPERGQPTIRVGAVGLDPSTSARLISVKQAFEGFSHRPIFGYGVTGFAFMDQQFARTLVETGTSASYVSGAHLCGAEGRRRRDARPDHPRGSRARPRLRRRHHRPAGPRARRQHLHHRADHGAVLVLRRPRCRAARPGPGGDGGRARAGRALLPARRVMPTRAVVARARKIRLLVMDVDGVLTDGRMMLSERGDELKAFNTHDGLAIALAKRAGIRTAMVTGESSPIAKARGAKLGVDSIVLGARRKGEVVEALRVDTTCRPRRCPSSATT